MPFVEVPGLLPGGRCVRNDDGSNVGPNTANPFGVDLNTLLRWIYRVKKWRMQASFSNISATAASEIVIGGIGLARTAATASGTSLTLETNIDPSFNETKFTCTAITLSNNANQNFNAHREDFTSGGGGFVNAVADANMSQSLFFSFEPNGVIYYYNGLYYPRITISAGANAQADGLNQVNSGVIYGRSQAFGGTFLIFTGGGLATGTSTLTMDGVAFTAQVLMLPSTRTNFDPPGSDTFANTSSSLPNSVIITPAAFWPYNPGDGGGPYFNTTTGVKIR